jgi:hypothetical protein
LFTTLGEGDLAAHLEACLAELPGVTIGSYPRLAQAGWRVKVTVESRHRGHVAAAMERLATLIGAADVTGVELPEAAPAE